MYLLYAIADAETKTVRNYVASSRDGEHFTDLFWFRAPTFARAFALLDGWFYFGLGTEIKSHGTYTGQNAWKVPFSKDELSSAAGTILRCPAPPSMD